MEVPAEVLDDADELAAWAAKSVNAALGVKQRGRKRG